MLKTNKNLIALFAGLFLVLLGIQTYLMYKTYQVKEREINRIVVNKLTDYTDKLEDGNGAKKAKNDSIQSLLILYKNKKINKAQFLNYFNEIRKNTEPKFSNYIDNQFKKEGYKIAIKIEYLSIISLPEKTKLINQPITLYETKNKVTKPGTLSTGNWETSSTSGENKAEKFNSFHVKSITAFEILNIKEIVFKELTLLILLCIFILGSVLWLFILTVKNLIQQQKQVEVLHTVVDNISHEFKTPIATLKIAAKSLNKNWNKENLPLVERQIARLESLMLQLNNDSEITSETKETLKTDWDYFIEDLKFSHPDIEFKLKNNAADNLPFDKTDMETIIKNFCENSVKYGASIVEIDIITKQSSLEIKVTDNGEGIAKNEQKNIFEKFYRIQSNNIHNTKGLGLGLFLVRNLVEKYNGIVDVTSEINVHTSFKITLPYDN